MDSFQPINIAFDMVYPKDGFSEDSTPIILLHGVTVTKEVWNNVSGLIADGTGRKVYRLDARNHGDSEWSDVFDYHTMAKDVSHFMDKQGIPKAIIVGHSMGGKTAMALALTEPEKVEKLVVEDISPAIMMPKEYEYAHKYLKMLEGCIRIIPNDVDELTIKHMVHEFLNASHTTGNESPEKTRFDPSSVPLKKTKTGFSWKTNLELLKKNLDEPPNPRDLLEGNFKGKTLFVYGTNSFYNVIQYKDLILEMFPEASFKAIEGASHLVHVEYPQEFAAAVLEFLK